jgi:hypothetical protein
VRAFLIAAIRVAWLGPVQNRSQGINAARITPYRQHLPRFSVVYAAFPRELFQ